MNVDILKFVVENVLVISVAFVSGAMLIWPLVRRGTGGPSVSTLEATLMINQKSALVVDVRESAEFEKGRILNARNIPLSQLEARAVEIEKFKEKPIIVACESGNRSGSAAAALRKRGFTEVFNLTGGLAAWQQAGLPTEK